MCVCVCVVCVLCVCLQVNARVNVNRNLLDMKRLTAFLIHENSARRVATPMNTIEKL